MFNATNVLMFTDEINYFVDIMCSYGADTAKNTVAFKTLQHMVTHNQEYNLGIPRLTLLIDKETLSKFEFSSFVHNIRYDNNTDAFVFDSIDTMFKGIIELLSMSSYYNPTKTQIDRLIHRYKTCHNIMETHCFVDDTCDMFDKATL